MVPGLFLPICRCFSFFVFLGLLTYNEVVISLYFACLTPVSYLFFWKICCLVEVRITKDPNMPVDLKFSALYIYIFFFKYSFLRFMF